MCYVNGFLAFVKFFKEKYDVINYSRLCIWRGRTHGVNDGAQAFEADDQGNLVLRLGGVPGGAIDPINGEPVPIGDTSNSLMLVALDDLNGGGLVGDGTGDEDGDTLEDADEAFNIGTDPCNPDTDGDGVPDNLDQCPLEGPPGAGQTNVDGCNIPD